MDQAVQFGTWLKGRRKALRLTQEDLAERMACSSAMVRKIEAGERVASQEMAELLAQSFAVPPGEQAAFVQFARGHLNRAAAERLLWQTMRSATAHPNNLAAPLTALIGRERELEELCRLIRLDSVRLVTLTGPPGIGKTRLSLEAGAKLLDHFTDGVFFAGLASVTDPDFVVPTIARSLGIQDKSTEPLRDTLHQFLNRKQMLLLLDNFEQVLDAAPIVIGLLEACPCVKVLVTSREALHIIGEQRFPVPPLEIPNSDYRTPNNTDPLATRYSLLATYPSVELFVERARAVDPGFGLSDQNAEAVAAICIALDGLPLAIELASARISIFTPQELRVRLDSRLSMLTGGPRNLPPRQRTLRAAIEWSYNLLNEDEQEMFTRLGVFVGGCTQAAAQAVCSPSASDVAKVLSSLFNKNLLQMRNAEFGMQNNTELTKVSASNIPHSAFYTPHLDGPRFTMVEVIREYAAERLAESGEEEKIKRLHAEYYLALAEAAEQASRGAEQLAWSQRLEREHDNLRAGLSWASSRSDLKMALRLVAALGWFWEARAHIIEGQEWLAKALSWARASGVDTGGAFAIALNIAGRLSYRQGKVAQARSLLEESVAVCRQLNDRQSILDILQNLGHVASHQGDYPSASLYREESLALSRATGDDWTIAGAFIGIGDQRIEEGNLEGARAAFEESLATYERIGSRWGVARALNGLGDLARCRSDYQSAHALYEKSLAIHRQLGTEGFVDLVLHNLGHTAQHEGDLTGARSYFEESLTLFHEEDLLVGVGVCLVGMAGVAATEDPGRAAVLLGAAKALLDSLDYHMDRLDRIEYDRYARVVYTQLDPQTQDECHEYGKAMSIQRAIQYALDE